jgi:hypothetical protein
VNRPERGDERIRQIRIELPWAARGPPGDLDFDLITARQDDRCPNDTAGLEDAHRVSLPANRLVQLASELRAEIKEGVSVAARRRVAQTRHVADDVEIRVFPARYAIVSGIQPVRFLRKIIALRPYALTARRASLVNCRQNTRPT